MPSKNAMIAKKNTKRLKFNDFEICPNILKVDVYTDTDAEGIATTRLHWSAGTLKKLDAPKTKPILGHTN